MDFIFNINNLKKKKIQKDYIKTSKSATGLSVGLITVLILFNTIFAVYGFGMKNTFIIQDVTDSGYGAKNIVLIWTILITVDIILVFLWFIQRLVVNIIFGKYISQRINESLIISDGELEYGYQNSVGAVSGDRVIIRMPIDTIRKIKINQKISRIELMGMVSSKYYENYSQRKTKAPQNNYKEDSLILFDYFEPGLIKHLKENYPEKTEIKK